MTRFIDTTGTAPRYDLSAIMAAAWTMYRAGVEYARAYGQRVPAFGECLAAKWKLAKSQMVEARRKAAVAAIPANQRNARIAALRARLADLDYLPAHMSYATAAAPIRAELAALAA